MGLPSCEPSASVRTLSGTQIPRSLSIFFSLGSSGLVQQGQMTRL